MPEKPLVLVADDDEDIRMLAAFRLERAGYTVLTAADGAEALRIATEQQPALAVLDWMMPKLTGLDVMREIRAAGGERRMPVIMLTARMGGADVAHALEAGADAYVKKPFSPHELRSEVEAALAAA